MHGFEHDGRSALVSNMQEEASRMDEFPVIIGDVITYFHDVSGGSNRDELFDVVNLIHRVQGPRSPYQVDPDQLSHDIEAHMDSNFYYLNVDAIRAIGNYPDEDYTLSLKVDSTMDGEYSFSKPLRMDADTREEWINYDKYY